MVLNPIDYETDDRQNPLEGGVNEVPEPIDLCVSQDEDTDERHNGEND